MWLVEVDLGLVWFTHACIQMIGGNSNDYLHEKITDFIYGRILLTLYLLSNNKLSSHVG